MTALLTGETMSDAERKVLEKKWFYRFRLPSGRVTETYIPPEVLKIHDTRLEMMFAALDPLFRGRWADVTCLDVACHEGFFSLHLADKGCRKVLGVDAREEHVRDARLIGKAYGRGNLEFRHGDVRRMDPKDLGTFDVVLMFGLLYHLENPIGALVLAKALTGRVCLLETQVAPNLTGLTDCGHYQWQKEMHGSFAIVDETEELANPESSVSGISLYPSKEGLLWVMRKLGFARVEVLPPPEGAYEQLAAGKRIMVAAYVS
jgi:ubiquinone/menaquinone biosynthesis C-methylase UbiE